MSFSSFYNPATEKEKTEGSSEKSIYLISSSINLEKHKRAKSIASDKIPSDPEAFSIIKDFIKKQIHDLTISAKLEYIFKLFYYLIISKDDYKSIAKKTTDKVYIEWKEKRRKWSDFFHDKRQSKIVELVKGYISKYRNKPSKPL